MAYLWIEDAEGWLAKGLAGDGLNLGALAAEAEHALLCRSATNGTTNWSLMSAPCATVRVNGEQPPAGLRVLADRDEIRIADGKRFYFTTESLLHIEPFPGAERPVSCGRCRQPIETGAPAVRCPGCGVWYNQSAELPCFTYSETCAFCNQPTSLDAGFRWTPEEER
jgi:hypothetical protein